MSAADRRADLLIELGTEELPPKALAALMRAFGEALAEGLDEARLAHGTVKAYASPRRLAVLVEALAAAQPAQPRERRGPPVSLALDRDGKALPPAEAFANKCGVPVAALERQRTAKGEWLAFRSVEPGRPLSELLAGIVERALGKLPVPRPMRWSEGDIEFVRPLHWLLVLHGKQVVDITVMGLKAGRETRGHRVHAPTPIAIAEASRYLDVLATEGRVIADFARRREMIEAGVQAAAADIGGTVIGRETLGDEVAALVEWPVPLLGRFDANFLKLPRETVMSTLMRHQRYFPLVDADGELMNAFVAVANLDSADPVKVRDGNERVIGPRLADAAFFWDSDRTRRLDSRIAALDRVVYRQGLGSLGDKTRRVAALASRLAAASGQDTADVERAAALAKCDLVTATVGEFPDLQGIVGAYCATADGERHSVASAIREHYLPRFAGDALPASAAGQWLALADRIDTLAGIFTLGKRPSGKRDPFGLRRAALGIVRILIECGLELDLKAAIAASVAAQPGEQASARAARAEDTGLAEELHRFVTERLRAYFQDRDPALGPEILDAVMRREPLSLLDCARRLTAVGQFLALDEAASLAAANKRIANILNKTGDDTLPQTIDTALLGDIAERDLYAALEQARNDLKPLLAGRDYTAAFRRLATLKAPVDRFFDEVMVMADDEALRGNRLALLAAVRRLFLELADLSRLSVT